jgi:hypothetical protein
MEMVRLKFAKPGKAVFFIADSDGKQLAKLIVNIVESNLIVPGITALKGKRESLRSKLFHAMISYARAHYLRVIAFNSFVYNKLKDEPERYADVMG